MMCDHNEKRPSQELDEDQATGGVVKKLKLHVEKQGADLGQTSDDIAVLQGERLDSTEVTKNKSSASTDNSSKRSSSKDAVSESDVGITEFIGDHCGFFGVIKQRFSDFLVSEIDLNGAVVKLNDLSLPSADEPEVTNSSHSEALSAETMEALQKLHDSKSGGDPVTVEVDDKSKEERRRIHEAVKALFPKLCSNTQIIDGKKMIVVKSPGAKKDQTEKRQLWPKSRGNYTHFVLYKENIDTPEAISLIAKFLRMKPGVFAYAGVKDKRARTVQRVSVYRTEAAKLLGLNKILRNMVIGNISYCKEPLRLGDLTGNLFKIVLRKVSATEEVVHKSVESLAEKGFLNYYGMQRFGTTSIPTHSIGLAILKSEWQTVVDLIMKPRPGEDAEMMRCRKLWAETKDADAVLQVIKKRNSIEAHLLHGLKKRGMKDLVGALNVIPRNSRLMYVHSYQSSLWNRILSQRIQKYGLTTIKGDLIIPEAKAVGMTNEELTTNGTSIHPKIVEADGEGSIYDVVLPLFGNDVLYPQNEMADWYRQMLADDGLDMDKIWHTIKDYSLCGSYRTVVVRPTNTEWSIVNYKDITIPLFQSDWDLLRDNHHLSVPSNDTDGPLQAVKLIFSLPRSSYATMALREVLHLDTSAGFQSTLNAS